MDEEAEGLVAGGIGRVGLAAAADIGGLKLIIDGDELPASTSLPGAHIPEVPDRARPCKSPIHNSSRLGSEAKARSSRSHRSWLRNSSVFAQTTVCLPRRTSPAAVEHFDVEVGFLQLALASCWLAPRFQASSDWLKFWSEVARTSRRVDAAPAYSSGSRPLGPGPSPSPCPDVPRLGAKWQRAGANPAGDRIDIDVADRIGLVSDRADGPDLALWTPGPHDLGDDPVHAPLACPEAEAAFIVSSCREK